MEIKEEPNNQIKCYSGFANIYPSLKAITFLVATHFTEILKYKQAKKEISTK